MFFWLSSVAAGIALCLLVWVFTQPIAEQRAQAPEYIRGSAMRLAWPWVLAIAPICGPFISWHTRQRLRRHIEVAGLESACLPEHITALQCLVFVIITGSVSVLMVASASADLIKSMLLGFSMGVVLMWWPRRWLIDRGRRRQALMLREFPFLLDMTTLCVEAGLNLQGALQQAAMHGPQGPLRDELRHALSDMRAGMPRMQALNELATRTDLRAVRSLVMALAHADQLGMNLGPLLRSQSEQRRTERFLRAEKLALEAPVKMLFPMVFCIFPCTFLVIGFPIGVKLMGTTF